MKYNNKKTNNKRNKDENVQQQPSDSMPKEIGGPKGLEPTRYGDWEKKGRCIDF